MRNHLSWPVAVATGIGAFLGIVTGLLIAGPQSEPGQTEPTVLPPAAETTGADHGTALPELTSELRNLSQRIDVLVEVFSSNPRQPVPVIEDSAVADRLEGIASRLEHLSHSAVRPARMATSLALPPLGSRPNPLPTLTDDNLEEFTKSHVLMSYQDVLDKYGRPDMVWPTNNSLNWNYQCEDESWLLFTFQEGMLVRISP